MSKYNNRRANGWRRDQIVTRVKAAYDTCWLCGKPVDKTLSAGLPGSPEVDERMPVSRGGSHIDFTNCFLAHRWCNRIRPTIRSNGLGSGQNATRDRTHSRHTTYLTAFRDFRRLVTLGEGPSGMGSQPPRVQCLYPPVVQWRNALQQEGA